MGWLVAIWALAALCGWAVHAAYDPALSLATSLPVALDPALAAWLHEIGATPGLRTVAAVGAAVVVGTLLTLVWLALVVLHRAGRAIRSDGSRPGFPEGSGPGGDGRWDTGTPRDADRRERQRALHEAVARTARRDPSAPMPSEPIPPEPRPTQPPAPQWGRGSNTERER